MNDPKTFRRTALYIGLSNLTTGLECYLREIATQSQESAIQTGSLYRLIKTMFSEWGETFAQKYSDKKTSYQSDAVGYITDVYTDPQLDNVVKTFLIAHRARNLVAHNFILEHNLYHALYGIVYTEICHALFYSWQYATQKGWV